MDSHEIAEQARILSHRRYAEVIDSNRYLLDEARNMPGRAIDEHGGTVGHRMSAFAHKGVASNLSADAE